jgi:hypothetical protein
MIFSIPKDCGKTMSGRRAEFAAGEKIELKAYTQQPDVSIGYN